MLNQKKCPRTRQLEGRGEKQRGGGQTETDRERGALDGILMRTPSVCKDCTDIHACLQ